MAIKRDYYEVLGVSRDCSPEELKRSFRKLAMDLHPDRNPDDAEAERRFKEAAEAYQVLSDPGRRRSYDMFGHAGVSAAGGAEGFEGFGFGDIFDAFFGGGFSGRGQARNLRGSDLRYDLTVDFEEAYRGAEREIEVPRLVICERCSGNGAEPGTQVETCSTCGGSGQVRRSAQSIFGQVVNVVSCPVCQGLSVADSPATMARNMKAEVREKLAKGYDQEQILAYFERSYGEFVRLEPPMRGVNWLVWFGPVAGLLAGGAVIAWAMKRSRGGPAAAGGRDVAFAAPAASDLPSRDTVPADPKLAAAVRRVRMLAYGWPQGFSPKAGS